MNPTKSNLSNEPANEKQAIVGECVGDEVGESDVVITTNIVPNEDQTEKKVSFLKSSSYLVYVIQQICLNVGVACGCLYTAAHIVKVSDADEMKAAFLISLQGAIEACVRIPFGYLADRKRSTNFNTVIRISKDIKNHFGNHESEATCHEQKGELEGKSRRRTRKIYIFLRRV